MAKIRVLSQIIIESDLFLDMPLSAQALYFHLVMKADDDGFIDNPKVVQRIVQASEEDWTVLEKEEFVKTDENGAVKILDWELHNLEEGEIARDYIEEKAEKKRAKTRKRVAKCRENKKALQGVLQGALQERYTNEESLENKGENEDEKSVTPALRGVLQGVLQKRYKKLPSSLSFSLSPLNNPPYSINSLNNPKKGTLKGSQKRVDFRAIADCYNDTCVSFPRLMSLSEARKKGIKARLNFYTVEDFKTVFQKAEASDFLKGKNSRNWRANFDWLINGTNFAKVLDGNYDNVAAPTGGELNRFGKPRNTDYDDL